MKIAKFLRTADGYSYESILPEDYFSTWPAEYARATAWVEVEFTPRPPTEIVPEQLAGLDAAEKELRAKFLTKLNEIAEKRAKLKALTHQPGEPA